MSGQQVSVLLQECLERALSGPTRDTRLRRRGLFPEELNTLLQEAKDRKWPFVEEKWQYKQSVASEDKINSSDLVRKHLPQLLRFLQDSLSAGEPLWAAAVIFLLDRLLYWMDGSPVLLKITKALHRRYPDVPIAPQVIIRQARVYLNTGKLQKAEFILSSLIRNNASTGCWTYERSGDQTLVQAVSLQVRGQVLQTLGLWLEAAELMWASLIGFYALPQPDKKGIGTSLGLLANILSSMNERDFAALQKKPHVDLGVLGENRHRLLAAARAAKMAAVFSQYGSLYVLTNVVAQGMCLLSYSFSRSCRMEDRQAYLALAKEAFEIGLLTKTTGDVVSSKLELHTFLKAAHGLSRAQRWMSGPSPEILTASAVCRDALTLFVQYCDTGNTTLSTEIMEKVQQIKSLLKVEAFPNSDPRSFIPDSYRSIDLGPVLFTLSDFTKTLDVFKKHHTSVCEAFESGARGGSSSTHSQCITAFQTDTEVLPTESTGNHSCSHSSKQNPSSSGSSFLADQSRGNSEERGSLGSFEVVHNNRGQDSNFNSRSPSNVPNTFRCNKGIQIQSRLIEEQAGTSGAQGNIPIKSEGRTTSRSFSSGSSWECVSGRTQSSVETEEDIVDPSDNISEITKDVKDGSANTFKSNRGAQSQSQPMLKEFFTTEDVEDDPPNTSFTQQRSVQKHQNTRASSSFSSSGSSWRCVSGQSQSSVETEEDIAGPALQDTKDGSGSNRGTQSQSPLMMKEPVAIKDTQNNPTNTEERKNIQMKLEYRASSSSLSGQTQSSIETEEDITDPSNDGSEISRDAKVCDSNTFRSNSSRGAQSQSQTMMKEPITTEDVEDDALNALCPQEKRVQKHLDARLSFSSGSSWECVSSRTQSSVETEEDIVDLSNNSSEAKDGSTSTFRSNKGTQSQSQRMREWARTQRGNSQKKQEAGATSRSSSSSWECVSGRTQSSVETEEDITDSHHHSSGVTNHVNAGDTKGGSASRFSLCDGSGAPEHMNETDQCQGVPSTESEGFEELGFDIPSTSKTQGPHSPSSPPPCSGCFKNCVMGGDVLTDRDLRCLLAGVCDRCLLERLPDKRLKPLERRQMETAYDAVVLKYSKASERWMGCETSVYIGKQMGVQGKQRQALELQYLQQEQLLSSYVGKEYLKEKGLHAHLEDVERQMTAQYYVTEFNKCLYNNNITTQIFFIPSEVLLVLEKDRIVTCLSAEPFMSGTFKKLTNNTRAKAEGEATKYGIAFGHFTYEFSGHQEVVVDLQGWVTANGKGLTYLTDPQIHSLRKPRSSNFHQKGINNFIRHQHGDECNEICRAAGLSQIT